jgi:hypothetical protein
MNKWLFCFIGILTLQCSPKVIHFTNDSIDFSNYKTYAIVNSKLNNQSNENHDISVYDQIESELNHEMNRRDYVSDHKTPNLLVRYELISNQNTQTRSVNTPYYYNGPTTLTTYTYLTSVLLVELIDFQTKKTVWQASFDLSQLTNNKKREEIINSAIDHIFNTYLHRSGSKDTDTSLIVK